MILHPGMIFLCIQVIKPINMKKLVFGVFLLLGLGLQTPSNAQIKLNVNLNIGSQPAWGPTGYDRVDYYYLPDIESYYYVPRHQFVYLQGRNWVFASTLPARYRGYDLYHGYKVVINEPRPYLHHNNYRVKYEKYRGGKGPRQEIIRDSHDERYKNNGRGNRGHGDKGHGKKGHD